MNIQNQIKKISLKNMIYPAIMLIIIIGLFMILPFGETFTPQNLENIWDTENKTDNYDYVCTTVDELYYSGYNVSQLGRKDYGYYYALKDNKCIFVLIPVSDTPKETIENYKLYGKIVDIHDSGSMEDMLVSLASDLGWSREGIHEVTHDFMISNADYHPIMYLAFFILLLLGIGVTIYLTCINLVHYLKPHTYPLCPHTDANDRQRLIPKVEEELQNNLILNFDDMYLTEHYFVELSKNSVIAIPLMRVVWGYRMGTLNYKISHKIPRYNLFLILKSGDTVVFVNKASEHTSLMLEALRNLNYGIILGYTDAKRKKAKEMIRK